MLPARRTRGLIRPVAVSPRATAISLATLGNQQGGDQGEASQGDRARLGNAVCVIGKRVVGGQGPASSGKDGNLQLRVHEKLLSGDVVDDSHKLRTAIGLQKSSLLNLFFEFKHLAKQVVVDRLHL